MFKNISEISHSDVQLSSERDAAAVTLNDRAEKRDECDDGKRWRHCRRRAVVRHRLDVQLRAPEMHRNQNVKKLKLSQ